MDEVAERLLKAGLAAPNSSGDNMVEIVMDGNRTNVPADVGIYLAMSNLHAVLGQMLIRLDSLHHHMSFRAHPKSQEIQTCQMCQAMVEATQAALAALGEQQDASVVAGNIGAGASVDGVGGAEEERETSSE